MILRKADEEACFETGAELKDFCSLGLGKGD